MERDDLTPLAGFFIDGEVLATGATVTLGEDAAHHARVRRLGVGERVLVADGAGNHARASIVRITKASAVVAIEDVLHRPPGPPVHLVLPVADRDRMLWLAEKSTELGVSSWRPVLWRRSRSVAPRGEGAAFATRVKSRMVSALVQSHAPWLPALHPVAPIERALAALPSGGTRLALDEGGDPLLRIPLATPVTIAVGPEGGLEPDELDALSAAGFRRVSLGANVLRFETAAVAAVAIVNAVLASPETNDG